jgi:hypothetical protein
MDKAGTVYLYRSNGHGGFLGARARIGAAWGRYQLVGGASLDGDRYADVLGVDPGWGLYYYKGKPGGGINAAKLISTGW